MANYSTDADLLKIRPDILSFGVASWTDQHTEAKRQIDRLIESRWYLEAASDYGVDPETTPFDSDLVSAAQMVRPASYKALELIYEYLMNNTPEPDGFFRLMTHFKTRFDEEFNTIMAIGLEYDWDSSDAIDESERNIPKRRTLKRL